jgi:hypothetical protein
LPCAKFPFEAPPTRVEQPATIPARGTFARIHVSLLTLQRSHPGAAHPPSQPDPRARVL